MKGHTSGLEQSQFQPYYNLTIKIGSLNVCGLRRRAQYPDFVEMVNEHDILCFSETKTDYVSRLLFFHPT